MSCKPDAITKLEDISPGEQSGWRPLSAKRKAQVLTIFYGGQFGLRCAAIGCASGRPFLDRRRVVHSFGIRRSQFAVGAGICRASFMT